MKENAMKRKEMEGIESKLKRMRGSVRKWKEKTV